VYGLDVVAFRLGMFVPVDFIHYGMRLVHGGVDERDLARAFRLALENEDVRTGTFNLFSPTPFEVEDEPRLVADPLAVLRRYYPGVDALVTAARGRQVEEARWYRLTSDGAVVPEPIRVYWKCDQARTVLGWQPRFDFARFLSDLEDGRVDYVRDNRYPVPNAPAPWRP
jgi:UDP-glucose 4-epimerase